MKPWIRTAVLTAVAVTAGACSDILFDERDHIYDGDPVVEFAPVMPAGNYVRTVSFPAGAQGTQTVSVRINYVAPPPANDVSGQVRVADRSTAVEGEDFVLPSGGAYTIPSNGNFTDLPVEVSGAGLADGETRSIFLELVDGDGFEVSANYSQFEVRVTKGG